MPLFKPDPAGGIKTNSRTARLLTRLGSGGGTSTIAETFESGAFSAIWGAPVIFGTGTQTVVGGAARTGSFGGHFDKPYGDSANYRRAAFTATNSLKCGADYRWTTVGADSNGTGPRVFAGANRIFDVFRQDATGAIALRYQSTGTTTADALYIQTGVTAALSTWYRLEVQMDYAAGANSRARVWVDGVLKIDQAGLTVYAGGYDAFQLGSEHTAQFLDMDVDNVTIDAVPVDPGDPGGGGAANSLISLDRQLVLSSDGTTVFNGRGVNAHTTGFSFSAASFDSMATEGVNLIRLGAQWKAIEGAGQGIFDATQIGHVRTSVERAAAEGINVILCLLINTPTWADAPLRIPDWARGASGPASPVGEWNTASQFDCLASSGEGYIRRMVQEFCEEPNVVGFDFCNEPDRSSAAPIQRGTERMLAWARDADTTDSKLWFVATNCYSSQSADPAFNDWDAITDWTNVVLQVHSYYAPATLVHGWRADNGIRDSGNGRYWNGGPEATTYTYAGTAALELHFASWQAISVAKNVPWILGEFGVKHAQAASEAQRVSWAQHIIAAAENTECAAICWWIYADTYAQDVWATTNTGYDWRPEAQEVAGFTVTGGGGTTPPTIRSVGALGETPDNATAAMTVTGMTLPAGTTTDDLMLMFCYFDSGAATSGLSITAPSGWTQLVDLPHAANANMLRVYAKVAGGAEGAPASPTFNGGTTGTSGATGLARVVSVIGADVSGGAAAALAGASGGNGFTNLQNMGAITGFTPSAADTRVFVAAGKKATFTSVATLTGDLTWVEDFEAPSSASADAGMVVNSAPSPGAAVAIANKTFTVTGGSTANGLGIMFAIKPA